MSNKKLKAFEARAEQAARDSVLVPSEISYLMYQADVLNTGCQQNSVVRNLGDLFDRKWLVQRGYIRAA